MKRIAIVVVALASLSVSSSILTTCSLATLAKGFSTLMLSLVMVLSYHSVGRAIK